MLSTSTAAQDARGVLSPGPGAQRSAQLIALVPQDNRPVLEGAASCEQRVGDIGGVEVWVVLEVGKQAPGDLRQGGLGFGGEGKGEWPREGLDWGSPFRARLGGGCLLQDQMRVGAADPKGGDAGATGAAVGLPGRLLGQKLYLPLLPIDFGRGGVDVQGLWQDALAHPSSS